MATGDPIYPYSSFNFRVEIDNIKVGSFSEVSGLSSDGDIVEYRNGDDKKLHVSKVIGRPKFGNIVMKRGITDNRELWDWRANIINGIPDRRNGAIILMDEQRNDVMRWEFEAGWIHKIDGPSLNAKGNEVGIESCEIVIESLSLK